MANRKRSRERGRKGNGGAKKSNVKRKIHIKWPKTLLSRAEPNAHPTSDKPNKFFKINYRVEQTNLHIYGEGEGRGGWGGGRQNGLFFSFSHHKANQGNFLKALTTQTEK